MTNPPVADATTGGVAEAAEAAGAPLAPPAPPSPPTLVCATIRAYIWWNPDLEMTAFVISKLDRNVTRRSLEDPI